MLWLTSLFQPSLQENSVAWVFSGELPSRTWGLEVANIDGRVIATGSLQEKFPKYHFLMFKIMNKIFTPMEFANLSVRYRDEV